jgi:trimeric autotransporter adhesin
VTRRGIRSAALSPRILTLAAVWLALLVSAAHAQTSSVPSPFPRLNATADVTSMIADADTLYIAGGFTETRPATGPFAVVSSQDRSYLRSWPGMVAWGEPPYGDGSVRSTKTFSVASDGVGGWFVGGDFQRVDGTSIGRLVHLLPDGTPDPVFRPEADGVVYGLLLHEGRLWAAGTFRRIGGRDISGIAALDPRTGAALDVFPHGADDSVSDLSFDPAWGRIYVAGGFTRVGGDAHPGVAAIDAEDGTVLDWVADVPEGEVRRVAAHRDHVYVTGKMHGRYEDMRIGAVAFSGVDGTRLPGRLRAL